MEVFFFTPAALFSPRPGRRNVLGTHFLQRARHSSCREDQCVNEGGVRGGQTVWENWRPPGTQNLPSSLQQEGSWASWWESAVDSGGLWEHRRSSGVFNLSLVGSCRQTHHTQTFSSILYWSLVQLKRQTIIKNSSRNAFAYYIIKTRYLKVCHTE